MTSTSSNRCPGEASPPPSWHLDFCDFPTGWHILRQGVIHTDRRCSYIQTSGAIMCDCGAMEAEWARRKPDVTTIIDRKEHCAHSRTFVSADGADPLGGLE